MVDRYCGIDGLPLQLVDLWFTVVGSQVAMFKNGWVVAGTFLVSFLDNIK